MKKLLKMVGLLLIAGALFVGCGHSPKDEDKPANTNNSNSNSSSSNNSGSNSGSNSGYVLSENISDINVAATSITLANGNWERIQVCNAENTSRNSTAGKKIDYTYSINGDTISLTEGEMQYFQAITYSDSSELSTRKSNAETVAQTKKIGGKNANVTVSGQTLKIEVSGNLSFTDRMYEEPDTTAELIASFPSNATIKTNSDNSKYYITWTDDYEEDMIQGVTYYDATYSAVLKKN